MAELTPPENQRTSRLTDLKEGKYGIQRGRVFTHWDAIEHDFKPPPGDYRDQLPPTLEEVAAFYAPIVQDGKWTFGLLEMWGHRARVAKSAVHIPCWEAFSWNPFKWRGCCFGRTCKECYWLGIDRTRWARTVYAAGLGREYTVPCSTVPDDDWRGRIAALCAFECCLTEAFSFGFGQFVAPGGCGFNFASCYDWHSREKIRRKYNLPGTLVFLPPGCDDCLTHCFCMYCASHQEMRELPVRGVDGPGLHVLDVSEQSFKHLPGWEQARAARALLREELLRREVPIFLSTERRLYEEPGRGQHRFGRKSQPEEDSPVRIVPPHSDV
eukprot:jgi/Botrbrau1/15784/Bobra.4_1s0136.1